MTLHAINDEPSVMRGFSTLADQVKNLRNFAANPRQRVRTGIESLDYITEGPAAGEVYTVLGRSFSGKSLVATQIMANNPEMPMIFFSLEMPARQALMRLYSQSMEVDAYDVQAQVKRNSLPGLIDTLQDKHPMQVIYDGSGMTLGDMSAVIDQYETYYGTRPVAVLIDYLELVRGGVGEGHFQTESIAKALKDWSKDEEVAVFLLHQTNRSESEWDPPTADSARGAGFTEADVVVGMWQPGRNPKLGEVEKKQMEGIVQMNVIKNRITGRTTGSKDIKLRMDPSLRFVDLSAEQTKKFYR